MIEFIKKETFEDEVLKKTSYLISSKNEDVVKWSIEIDEKELEDLDRTISFRRLYPNHVPVLMQNLNKKIFRYEEKEKSN